MTLRALEQSVGLTVVTAALAVCVRLVDRPLALWLNARFSGTTVFAIAAFILRPLDGLLLAGAVLLAVAAAWRRRYGRSARVDRLVTAGVGAVVALLSALVLKVAIGRSQVYPPFLHSHIYGFRPFAAVKDFMAFPSATMAAVGALVVGVDAQRRSHRAAAAVVLMTLAVALLVTGSHWLSDIIGGTYLGMLSGAAVAGRLRRSGLEREPLARLGRELSR